MRLNLVRLLAGSGQSGIRAKSNSASNPLSGSAYVHYPYPIATALGLCAGLEEWVGWVVPYIDLESADGICAHFGRCYQDMLAAFTGDSSRLVIGRRLLHAYARRALERLGWTPEDAVDMCHQLVGLEIGAKLPAFPEVFQKVPRIAKQQPGVEAAKVLNAPVREVPKAVSPVPEPVFRRRGEENDYCPFG